MTAQRGSKSFMQVAMESAASKKEAEETGEASQKEQSASAEKANSKAPRPKRQPAKSMFGDKLKVDNMYKKQKEEQYW